MLALTANSELDPSVTSAVAEFRSQLASRIDGELALLAVSGSRAYGTDRPDSDVDLRGCYLAPPRALLSGAVVREQYETSEPDTVVFELAKLVGLAAKGNPNALEILFSPVQLSANAAGTLLLERRSELLSLAAYDAYRGFATSQLRRLTGDGPPIRPDKRAKHLLHCFRLCDAAEYLFTHGTVLVTHPDPDRLRTLAALDDAAAAAEFERALARIDAAADGSGLPERCDPDAVAQLVFDVRTAACFELSLLA